MWALGLQAVFRIRVREHVVSNVQEGDSEGLMQYRKLKMKMKI